MNKSKIFLLAAVTALAGGALVGVASLSKTNNAQFAKASVGDPVAHHIAFEKGDAKNVRFDNEHSCYTFDLSHKTPNGNDFEASVVTIKCYVAENITIGGESDDFIFKVNNPAFPYYIDEDYKRVTIGFDYLVDVESSVYGTVDRTVCYNQTEPSYQRKTKDFEDLSYDGYEGYLDYTFDFSSQYQEYVAIHSIDFYYSCTY